MTRERNELKAGAFIIITLFLVIAVIVWINGANIGPMQTRTVAFKLTDNIGGLRTGDDVRLGGLKVGAVREITPTGLDTADPRILVTFTMPASYVVHPNASIGLESSLTGAANLNIDYLGAGTAISDSQLLTGRPDAKSALLASLGRSGPQLEGALTQINGQTLPAINGQTLPHINGQILPRVDQAIDSAN